MLLPFIRRRVWRKIAKSLGIQSSQFLYQNQLLQPSPIDWLLAQLSLVCHWLPVSWNTRERQSRSTLSPRSPLEGGVSCAILRVHQTHLRPSHAKGPPKSKQRGMFEAVLLGESLTCHGATSLNKSFFRMRNAEPRILGKMVNISFLFLVLSILAKFFSESFRKRTCNF